MSSWLKLSILATVVFAFMAASAYASSSDVKYSESYSGNYKKVGTGTDNTVKLFKNGRFTLQGTFKVDEALTIDPTSTFSIGFEVYDSEQSQYVTLYEFEAVLDAFAAAYGENSSDKGVNYTATKRSAKAIKIVKDAKDKDVVIETVTFSHGKDNKSISFTVAGSLANVGTNTAPSYSGALAAVDASDDEGGDVVPGFWGYLFCSIEGSMPLALGKSSEMNSSLPADGTRAAKSSHIKMQYDQESYTQTYFNPSINLKGAYKYTQTSQP